MVFAAIAATVLILFAALTIDIGMVWSARTQSQNADDAAALAAAANMIDPAGPSVSATAAANSTVNNPAAAGGVNVRNSDITFGYFDIMDGSFDPNVDQSDPNLITGARVNVAMDNVANDASPAFLARLVGRTGFTVNNTAVGYLGFDGDWDPGEFDLPIAIDSCDLVSDPDGCGDDFCVLSQFPVNPCLLSDEARQQGDATTGAGDFTCLDFSPTMTQNACWTDFGDDPSVNNPSLQDVVDNGNPDDVVAGDEVNLDNGDKTSTQKYIREKMLGEGAYTGNPAGENRYPDLPGNQPIDSWVVKLPVVECQDLAHCAGPDNFKILGGVCFQIREVTGPSPRLVKGRFLCPADPDPDVRDLYETYCGDPPDQQDAPGGCNFGDRAERVVLVE
jgi:hypothetical protein